MNRNRKIIYLASFLFSLAFALTLYINSSFLLGYVGTSYLSVVYAAASILNILGLLFMPKLLTRAGNRRTGLILSVAMFASLLLLALGSGTWLVLASFIVLFAANSFLITSFDIFIEDFSRASSVGKFRGFYLTIINAALVVSQMIAGRVLMKSSYQGIYLLAAGFMLLVSVIFILFLHDFHDPEYKKVSIIKTFKLFIKNRNISKIYLVNFILRFFYAWMIIYTPIYLHQYLGLPWNSIAFIFTIMLLPFVILESPMGKLSDKIGEKKMLIAGFAISIVTTVMIPFFGGAKLWPLTSILFLTRIGAAAIEVMSESYFFKSVSEENADAISFFRNTQPLSFIIAPLFATLVLIFIPSFKYIFFVLGAVLMLGLLLALRLEDIK